MWVHFLLENILLLTAAVFHSAHFTSPDEIPLTSVCEATLCPVNFPTRRLGVKPNEKVTVPPQCLQFQLALSVYCYTSVKHSQATELKGWGTLVPHSNVLVVLPQLSLHRTLKSYCISGVNSAG